MPESKSILIVDDEESVRLLLQRILESIPGLEIDLADGGEAALGVCDYVVKPIDRAALLAAVRTQLGAAPQAA